MDIYISKGKIYKVLDVQKKTEKFQKQEFILQVTNPTDKGTFIEFIRLQCINDKMRLIDGAKKGDFCICKWTISGRKIGTGDDETFYTNLDVQDLTIINKANDVIGAERKSSESYSQKFPGIDDEDEIADNDSIAISEDDDLPF